jgi:formyltetrahydrofolate synthetase
MRTGTTRNPKRTFLNPAKNPDWKIAEAAEKTMKTVEQLSDELGLHREELLPHGHYVAKLDFAKILQRCKKKNDGKYIDITAITPTPLGEGKSTTTMGLTQGLGKRGKKVIAAIRQPSGGPTMNIKGSAAGGGLSQCIPFTPFSLGLTGDINAVMNAHNLAMVALTSRMQHERNYVDERLQQIGLRRLDIDPSQVEIGWVIDFCAQALRNIVIGIGGKTDGYTMQSHFNIAVSSEVMSILALSRDLKDLRQRMGRIIVAYDKKDRPVTTSDLEVAGAMTAWLLEALNPNLLQTIEGQPVLVHAGPFANISIGQSSIIADRVGLKLADYHVTESGFAADIGFEKFVDIKCRLGGMRPNAAVLVATVRALKCHGGAPVPVPGKPLPQEYAAENVGWVEKGCENLLHHLRVVKAAGVNPVVCINMFSTDTKAEINAVRRIAEAAGARVALSRHWAKGGEGALELADAVLDACNDKTDFRYLYDMKKTLRERITQIAEKVYGAAGVKYTPQAAVKAEEIEKNQEYSDFATCMVKTHLSVTDDPTLKGVPKDWMLHISDILVYGGARLIVPVAGAITLMPGTASDPSYRRVDVDTDTGRVTGLF